MWYTFRMEIRRTVTIVLPDDGDLRRTLGMFRAVQQDVSAACFNEGAPLSAVALQRAVYHTVKGALNSQMTITALRLVAGAYISAKRNKRPATKPFTFARKSAMFLVGKRGRDADFRKDSTLSIWTVGGRKHIAYRVPDDFRPLFDAAKEIDSLTVIERDGKLIGRVALTLDAPDPQGVLPVGIDLNETNALVAVDTDGRELFVSGKMVKVANMKTRKTRSRLQRKLATRKAEQRDTRSVRRVLKRLGRTQRNRTTTFCKTTAKTLIQWVPDNAVVVLEDLNMPQPSKKTKQRKGVRRRMSRWQFGQMRAAIEGKAQERGIAVALINPAYTSQDCSRCGLRGNRRKHSFVCPHCGHAEHADKNAARNIRDRFTSLRRSAGQSMPAEARSSHGDAGKPPASAGGR
jgi:putative transposase